jgi:16S rRNA (guanine(1405)-N(7))-methyltransferase
MKIIMLLQKVKDKKEFRGLSDNFVSRILVKYSDNLDVTDPKDQKKLIKQTRAKLREIHGAFRRGTYNKKEAYLQELDSWDDKEGCIKILKTHISTNERIDYLEELYARLQEKFSFKSVLDLGCGFNIFTMPWMGKVDYYGIEVNKEEVDFCNSYLDKFGLRGVIRWGDILSFDSFVKTDVTFLFKMLEAIESVERGSTKYLLEKIQSPYIVASFATRSLGGKKRISSRRLKWFEEMVTIVDKFELGDEVYYIIKKG